MSLRGTLARLSVVGLPVIAAQVAIAAPSPSAVAGTEADVGPTIVARDAPGDTIDPGPLPIDSLLTPGPIHPDTMLPEELRGVDPSADTVVVEDPDDVSRLPSAVRPLPADWRTGTWDWNRAELEATRALTLLELLEQIPGVIPLRGGDYGQPAAVTAFGAGGGRVRIFSDGAELPPLDGGVADLARIGISGVGRVRVERRPGELRVEMWPLELVDPRPYTLLEVGTGDLNTNLFRGTFGHPDALGGSIVLSLDRVDTQGSLRQEPGASFGGHVRHTVFQGDRGGLAWEYRTMTSRRPQALWDPGSVGRSDLAVHGRYRLGSDVLASAFVHRGSLDGNPDGELDPGVTVPVDEGTRTQFGGRLSVERGRWWTEVDARLNRGEGRPGTTLGLAGGGDVAGIGGASASVEREGWDDGGAVTLHGRLWSAPWAGLSIFAEVEDGRRGIPRPVLPAVEPEQVDPVPPTSFDDRSAFRLGASFDRGDLHVGIAGVRVDADSLHPMGLAWDRQGEVTAGGSADILEVSGRLPLHFVLSGLAVEGAVQLSDTDEAWRYLPGESYQGALRYRNVFLESENLEVWFDAGVRGRSAMALPLRPEGEAPGLTTVPSFQSWYAFLQIRITSAKLFLSWDNFTVRELNQDFPDRVLPHTRVMYGIRWTMWN